MWVVFERCVDLGTTKNRRSQSLASLMYSRGDAFKEELLIGALSSVPRLRFARALEGRGEGPTVRRVPDAMGAIRGSSREILTGPHTVTGFLLNREVDAPMIRLKLYASLTRSILYMEANDIAHWGDFRSECPYSSDS